ncbi:hypothetical protein JMA_32490 [Jeotgalibacillus malaysiensis]|uniref:Uncharacterized protein n=1 Tax=Jeotgalibacillus malaysiensis TaxID=1508404 RepID=A0A0B5AR53_9BACL|nr:hypothetical protein [Jeotgalibacillus malaysiensis]AJD92566.1 hypothetical protein JMA_32490 [Jeotgalibacillus malaysiensis]
MNPTGLSHQQLSEAINLIRKAADLQESLQDTVFADQVMARSIPVVWFGRRSPGSLVTVGTNPSSKEFVASDGSLLAAEKSRFFVREKGVSLYQYQQSEQSLIETVEHYQTYFERKTVYSSWFGKRDGAKLEGFLNGIGYSFYKETGMPLAVHIDFFPIPTLKQMGTIKGREGVMDSPDIKTLLTDTIRFLSPGKILILGKEHCERFQRFYPETKLGDIHEVEGYPDARFQKGFSEEFKAEVTGLHFKPSEQFLALGGGADDNGLSHGSYGGREAIRQIGEAVARRS